MYSEKKKEYNKQWKLLNKEKVLETTRLWRKENKEKIKVSRLTWSSSSPENQKRSLLKKYKLSLEDYNLMFEEQNGCCKICNTHQTDLKKPLFVDHCHITGNVRGLLCSTCNSALGMLKDNVSLFERATHYLRSNGI